MLCAIHQKEMRLGKYGQYFCATKTGDGPKDWCKFKVDSDGSEKPTLSQSLPKEAKLEEIHSDVKKIIAILSANKEPKIETIPISEIPF